jgi:endoglycosylceramidase
MGIPSGITRVVDAHGRPDALQAFAPHGYDIVVDTRDLALASNDRLALIFQRHAETGKRLDLPVLIGEWGAYGAAGPEILPTARFNVDLVEPIAGNTGHIHLVIPPAGVPSKRTLTVN